MISKPLRPSPWPGDQFKCKNGQFYFSFDKKHFRQANLRQKWDLDPIFLPVTKPPQTPEKNTSKKTETETSVRQNNEKEKQWSFKDFIPAANRIMINHLKIQKSPKEKELCAKTIGFYLETLENPQYEIGLRGLFFRFGAFKQQLLKSKIRPENWKKAVQYAQKIKAQFRKICRKRQDGKDILQQSTDYGKRHHQNKIHDENDHSILTTGPPYTIFKHNRQ